MDKALISRAMKQLAKHRVEKERKDPEARKRRKKIVAKAGRASWGKLTKQEREERIARMHAGRRKQRESRSHGTHSGPDAP
jgi:hypothetical protein